MTIIYNYTLLYRKNIYSNRNLYTETILFYISVIWNISMRVLSPFASSLHARRCCVFRKHGETAQEQSFSSLQSSKGERSNIL